ncbi:MAG: spheroidene monooxygenase [Paracoccaceae bacterium]|jgi:spheroidene monooxygenase|nr:spheroidene monooxygenase [Paracoccaceae bacterium]
MQTVSLSLFHFPKPLSRLWVLGQMALARWDLQALDQAQFWKLCGSGTGEGFTPRPNTAVWAILAAWATPAVAKEQVADAKVYARWRAHAAESYTIFLEPASARGAWGGVAPFHPQGSLPDGPVAALTRARVRPARMLKFWQRVPDISSVIGADPNVIFKIGIGEVPLVQQITFSIWPDTASMAHFARGDGPHGRAIRAVRDGNWFAEELYARFRLTGTTGTWGGRDPLAPHLTNRQDQDKDAA